MKNWDEPTVRMNGDAQAPRRSDDRFPVSGFPFPVFHSLHPAIDILACPDCGGRLRLLATIDDRRIVLVFVLVVVKTSTSTIHDLDLPVDLPMPARARQPAWLARCLPGFDAPADYATEWPG
jgi:hypothetical protein